MGRLIRVAEGNAISIPFTLRTFGVLGNQDVSGADNIVLEVTAPDGTNMGPLPCDPDLVGADWANGQVIAVIDGTNVTATRGTYEAGLTVSMDGSLQTRETLTIEVEDRPGWPYPA